jgi:hypothetical protein
MPTDAGDVAGRAHLGIHDLMLSSLNEVELSAHSPGSWRGGTFNVGLLAGPATWRPGAAPRYQTPLWVAGRAPAFSKCRGLPAGHREQAAREAVDQLGGQLA